MRGGSNGENGTRVRTAKPEPARAPAWASTGVTSPFPLGGVQRQVKVGAPGDAAEHEAQRTADHVASGPSNATPAISRVGLLQRAEAQQPTPEKPATGAQRAEAEQTTLEKPTAGVQRAGTEEKKPAEAVQRAEAEPTTPEKPATSMQRAGTEEKKSAEALQRAEAEQTTPEKPTAGVQRAGMEEKKTTEAIQRCGCCMEEPTPQRASGTASIYRQVKEESGAGDTVRRKTAGEMDAAATHAVSTKDVGEPLRPHVRQRLEACMGVDLSGVRVHEGPSAQGSAAAVNARAFTYKSDIWLGRGESQENTHLMAHEAAHVVQQGAAVRRAADAPKHEEEEQPVVRRSLWDKVTGVAGAVWDATGGKVVDAAGNAIAMGADFLWKVVKEVAPAWIIDIIQGIREKGIVGYLRDKLSGAFNGIFSGLGEGEGFIPGLMKTFSSLLSTAHEIIAALGRGDCQPLFDAVNHLGEVLKEIAGEAWDKIKAFFAPIGDFFSDLWKKFGAPVVDFLGDVAADIWNDIKALGQKIWDGTQPVRDALAAAWKWIKDELGIGDEPEGQNGLLQWVQKKLGEAWDWFKDKLEPVIGPMKALVAKIKAILPLDAILNLRQTVHDWLHHISSMVGKMRKPQGVTENQADLRDQILPAIKASIVALGGKIHSAGSWVAGQIGGIGQTVTGLFSSLRSNPILGKLSGAIQWVQDKVTSLSDWVQSGVVGLFDTIGKGVAKLAEFVEPVLNVLKKIVSVIANVVKELPGLVLGPIWKAIPACIRDPIKDFIIEHILSAIPIISTFLKIPDIWSKIQKLVMDFLAQVFVKGDLGGAAMTVIRFVLEAVGINVDLMLSVLAKAADSLDEIIMHPVEFLGNLAGAVGKGLRQFVSNIGTHLVTGLVNWLVGPLKDLGVEPLKDLSLKSILGMVLGILGITEAKLRAKAEKAIGPGAMKVLEEAWKWIKALISGGIGGIWEEIKSRLSDLWNMIMGGISKWITTEVVEAGVEKLIEMCNPVGAIIEAIRTIYKTLTFLVNKANQILALVDSVLNSLQKIVAGDISSAANWIETALARTVPTILAFFADWVGIGDPAPHVREVVVSIQSTVDSAIDWLIDKAISIGKSILGALGLGEKPDDRTPEEKARDLDSAMAEARQLTDAPDADEDSVSAGLAPIKKKYRLNTLELDPEGEGKFEIVGELNPRKTEEVELAPGNVETKVSYGSVSSTLGGTSMVAHPLTPKHDEGSAPSASPGVWDLVKPDVLRREGVGLYVRGHLLNQQLGGPGDEQNLTPITYKANADHLHSVEKVIKGMINAPKKSQQIVHYEVTVAGPSRAAAPEGVTPAEKKLTRGLEWKWWPLKATGDAKNPKLEKLPGGDDDFVKNVPPWPHV